MQKLAMACTGILAITLLSSDLSAAQQNPADGRGQGLFTQEWHAGRRAALREHFMKYARDKDGIIVLRGAGKPDDYKEFRQNNNFWYFTGLETPNAVYITVPKTGEEWLLVPPSNPASEIWVGDLKDPAEAQMITGIENCLPLGSESRWGSTDWSGLEDLLAQLAKGHKTFYTQGQPAENWMMSRDNLQSAQREIDGDPYDGRVSRESQFMAKVAEKHGVEVKDFTVAMDALRVTKTEPEIQAMRRACEIASAAHAEVMRTARPGEYEWQQAARMLGRFRMEGAMGAGYEAIVGSGPNAIILHYNLNNRQLQDDEVVMIDYGPEFRYTVADISRSWPTTAKFTPRQREVYEAVYAAQEAAFAECRPGSNLSKVHQAAVGELARRGFRGKCNHGVSHWLGMATHDVGRGMAKFKPGMMFTVEPGVYLPEEGIGVRIEDIVVITETGFELVSISVPRGIDEIEALRAEAFAE